MGRSREGNLHNADQSARAEAWAHWAVLHLTELTGAGDRNYPALLLDGQFHAPRGGARPGPTTRPHLEIPRWVMDTTQPEFADRLAQIGNGLAFPWWVVPEVLAVKRCLFPNASGSLEQTLERLAERRSALVEAVEALNAVCSPRWNEVEALIHSDPAAASAAAADEFTGRDVIDFFGDAAGLSLRVAYDTKLRENSPDRAARRVGVWQIQGVDEDGHRFALGVITPRLTANSLFRDPLFRARDESPAALLVRGLVLNRFATRVLGGATSSVATRPVARKAGVLRAVVSKPGAKIPEASVEAAVNFLHTYPNANEAWDAITDWGRRSGTQLTILQEGFLEAHRRALRFVQRAEEPERGDINIMLPLGWDDRSRVVRATFSRGDSDDTTPG